MAFNKNLVAKRLKQARLRAKLSQKKLGIASGIDEFSASARMNQYETGKHVPDLLTLKQISNVLNIPVAYFYAEDDYIATLLEHFGKLNKKQKQAVLDLVIQNIQN